MGFVFNRALAKRATSIVGATLVLSGVAAGWLWTKNTPDGESATRNIVCWNSSSGSGLCIREDGSVNASGSYLTNGSVAGDGAGAIVDHYVNAGGDTMTGSLTFSGVATDITSGTNEDIVINPNGTGKLNVLGTISGATLTPRYVSLLLSGAIKTGDTQAYFTIPFNMSGFVVTNVYGGLSTAGTSGTSDVQLRNMDKGDRDILSTKLTIDANESESETAATSHAVNTSNDDVQSLDRIAIDIDAVSTGAEGLLLLVELQNP